MRSLHALHHGREIQCVQLLQAPWPHQAIAVITGGEDSTLRNFVFHPDIAGQRVSLSLVTSMLWALLVMNGSTVWPVQAI